MSTAKDLARTIIHFLESRNGTAELGEVIGELQSYYENQVLKNDTAIVTAAAPLSETDQAEILVQLREIFKRQLRIELRIDPDLIGGLKIQVGDVLIDRSLRSKLVEIKNAMLR